MPLFVWLSTPFMRPMTWKRLLFTYPIPAVPFTCLWDGMVSQLRAYTIDELEELGRSAGSMVWRAGTLPIARGTGRLTYLTGWPTVDGGSRSVS